MEQLAQDTETLKKAEQERTERLDSALSGVQTILEDFNATRVKREHESLLVREQIQSFKDALPRALDEQKRATDDRLLEINAELASLKTLLAQRMSTRATSATSSSFMRRQSTPAINPSSSEPISENSIEEATSPATSEASKTVGPSNFNRASPLAGGTPKASIPAWQMAMSKNPPPPATASVTDGEKEADGSSS